SRVLHPLSLHDALPISTNTLHGVTRDDRHLDDETRAVLGFLPLRVGGQLADHFLPDRSERDTGGAGAGAMLVKEFVNVAHLLERSEEHTSELQSRENLV